MLRTRRKQTSGVSRAQIAHHKDMRHRASLMLLLAALFAIGPFLQWRQQQNACVAAFGNRGMPAEDPIGIPGVDSPECPVILPTTPFVQGLGILSVACLGGFLVFLVQGVAARRREQELLHGAGVDVPEDELPIEE